MGSRSKNKGSSYERELVNEAKALGFEARRAYASNGIALGEDETVDLKIGKYRIQAKRRAKIASFLLPPAGCDAVATRQDKGESLIIIPFKLFLKLIAAEQEVTDGPIYG